MQWSTPEWTNACKQPPPCCKEKGLYTVLAKRVHQTHVKWFHHCPFRFIVNVIQGRFPHYKSILFTQTYPRHISHKGRDTLWLAEARCDTDLLSVANGFSVLLHSGWSFHSKRFYVHLHEDLCSRLVSSYIRITFLPLFRLIYKSSSTDALHVRAIDYWLKFIIRPFQPSKEGSKWNRWKLEI